MSHDSRVYQLGFFGAVFATIGVLVFIAGLFHGFATTWSWIAEHPALSFFLLAAAFSLFPAYREGEEKLRRIWKETSKTLILVTVASFFVWYRSFMVTPDSPLESALYSFGGKAWYFTGFMLFLNILGVPVASYLMADD